MNNIYTCSCGYTTESEINTFDPRSNTDYILKINKHELKDIDNNLKCLIKNNCPHQFGGNVIIS